jgi:hypothetical protein
MQPARFVFGMVVAAHGSNLSSAPLHERMFEACADFGVARAAEFIKGRIAEKPRCKSVLRAAV